MDWLRIEGVGVTLASLKVSVDTYIQYLNESDPKALKLFNLVGLLPGGVSEEELNYLWGEDWPVYTNKLCRASLLLKKTELNGLIKYSLLPFMNNYAYEGMREFELHEKHLMICKFFSKIC